MFVQPTKSYQTLPQVISQKKRVKAKQGKTTLKLSVVNQFFPPDFAATGQLIEELAVQLGEQGVDIEVFTGQPGYAFETSKAPSKEIKGSARIRRSRITQIFSKSVKGKALNGVLFALRTALYLVANRDRRNLTLLTTAPPFLPIVGYIVNLLFGSPYACLLYDLYPDIAIELGVISRQHWVAKIWKSLNCRVWRRAKVLIVLSPAMKERIISICPEVADKISIIHSWSDPDLIRPIAKEDNWFAQQYNLDEKFTVLYSGNTGRCHDMDTILAAAARLKDEPIQFVFIGSAAKQKDLTQKAYSQGLNNILFLPYQDKSVLPYSLTACDLSLVSVSPGMESLVAPSKFYSCLASGRPVAIVCPQHTYLSQMVQEANCGNTFENGDDKGLADFIRYLSRDRQLAEKMGLASRQYLEENFTPEIIAEQYEQVLQEAV
jgi:glycosyltransferase involved in cell wall biosynthesis